MREMKKQSSEMRTTCYSEILEERDHVQDIGLDGKLYKHGSLRCGALFVFRIGLSGGLYEPSGLIKGGEFID
jgi:hypothetical protein